MGFAHAIATCFRKYVTFSGRAARAEFWWFVLLWAVVSLLALVADTVFNLQTPLAPSQSLTIGEGFYTLSFGVLWLSTLVQLAFLLPLLAVGSRRLHDRGVSGWWQLILLLSCCLLIPQLVLVFAFWILPSKREPNRYGPVPGAADEHADAPWDQPPYATPPADPSATQAWQPVPPTGLPPGAAPYGGPPAGTPYGPPSSPPSAPPRTPPESTTAPGG